MKMCITATDLNEHYQNAHVGAKPRRLERRELPAVTVGLIYLALVVWLWVACHQGLHFLSGCFGGPFSAFLDNTYSRDIRGVLGVRFFSLVCSCEKKPLKICT